MVRFEDDKLVIELSAHSKADAIEQWAELQVALCDLLHNVSQENICDDSYYNVPKFMRELMPNWEVLKKMNS